MTVLMLLCGCGSGDKPEGMPGNMPAQGMQEETATAAW